MRKKTMSSKWKISWDEYVELTAFCRQYWRKKQDAANILTLNSSVPRPVVGADGEAAYMPHGSGGASSPVERQAERRERLLADCELIERVAMEVAGDLYPVLMNSVTRKGGVKAATADAPISDQRLYVIRRRFFYELREARLMKK